MQKIINDTPYDYSISTNVKKYILQVSSITNVGNRKRHKYIFAYNEFNDDHFSFYSSEDFTPNY